MAKSRTPKIDITPVLERPAVVAAVQRRDHLQAQLDAAELERDKLAVQAVALDPLSGDYDPLASAEIEDRRAGIGKKIKALEQAVAQFVNVGGLLETTYAAAAKEIRWEAAPEYRRLLADVESAYEHLIGTLDRVHEYKQAIGQLCRPASNTLPEPCEQILRAKAAQDLLALRRWLSYFAPLWQGRK